MTNNNTPKLNKMKRLNNMLFFEFIFVSAPEGSAALISKHTFRAFSIRWTFLETFLRIYLNPNYLSLNIDNVQPTNVINEPGNGFFCMTL